MNLARTTCMMSVAALAALAIGGCNAAALPIDGVNSVGGVDGMPAIGGKAKCMTAAFTWMSAVVDTGLAAIDPFGTSTSLAVDDQGNAAIAYGDDVLHFATGSTASGWTTQTFPAFGTGREDGFSSVVPVVRRLRSHGDCHPHRNPPSSADVRLGDGTEATLPVPMGGPVVTDLAMVLDADGLPHIAVDRSDIGLGYAWWDGGYMARRAGRSQHRHRGRACARRRWPSIDCSFDARFSARLRRRADDGHGASRPSPRPTRTRSIRHRRRSIPSATRSSPLSIRRAGR